MNEKQKAALGLLHNPDTDLQMLSERIRCKNLCHRYNKTEPSNLAKRYLLIKKIVGSTKKMFWIEQTFYCDYGYNIHLGEAFYSNHNLVILDCAKVTFGDHVMIGPNCGFYCAGHPLDSKRRNALLEYAKPITVGNNVWIGGNVVVLPGVTIGNDVVIGAGSVVTHDIPSGVVAVGNPCKVLRPITAEDETRTVF